VFRVVSIVLAIFLSLLLVTPSAFAAQPEKAEIFSRLPQPVQQTVLFQRVHDGKILYQQNADQLLIPASVSKLMTAAVTLSKYGPHRTFQTQIFHTGSVRAGTIEGDLVIVGVGDPLILNEKLWQMAADFRHMGIRAIAGDLIIDNSLFPGPSRDVSRQASKHRSSNAYDAPVTAFGVNYNTFPVAVAPGAEIGQAARISIDPYAIVGIELRNMLDTSADSRSNYQVSRETDVLTTFIDVRGQIAQLEPLRKVYRSVGNPEQAAGETVRAFLRNEGIEIKGGVREGLRPSTASRLYEIESYPVSRMLLDLNKFSNNYVADVLLQKVGGDFYRPLHEDAIRPGSLEAGRWVLDDFLRQTVGLKPPYALYNGSGLDTRNQLSAAQVVKLLRYMAQRMDLYPEFLASLPAAGYDGTLKNRFRQAGTQKLQGVVRAKTGTLTSPVSVNSLGGYLHHPQHGLVAFAIIENGVAGKPQPALADLRARQDRAIVKLWDTW
jgi:serine-type D-Ala-D-Ala carboxypeptidase/endopeptidase (penicillin-binding protein 4)